MEMPARIVKLPLFRARPIPVTALTTPEGGVDFRVPDHEGINKVFTLDRRDFSVYRLARGGRFSVIP